MWNTWLLYPSHPSRGDYVPLFYRSSRLLSRWEGSRTYATLSTHYKAPRHRNFHGCNPIVRCTCSCQPRSLIQWRRSTAEIQFRYWRPIDRTCATPACFGAQARSKWLIGGSSSVPAWRVDGASARWLSSRAFESLSHGRAAAPLLPSCPRLPGSPCAQPCAAEMAAVLFLLRGSSASRRVVAGQSSCRWSTDIKLGSNLWLLAPHEHSACSATIKSRARAGFCHNSETARAAFAEPSQDVYVAAKQFQTNNLLGCPGRRPDTAPYLIYFAPSPVA